MCTKTCVSVLAEEISSGLRFSLCSFMSCSTPWSCHHACMAGGEDGAEEAELRLAACRFEFVDAKALGVDPATWDPTEAINFARAVLGTLALRPDEVLLVVSGDLVRSVRDRLPAGTERDSFNDDRGAGLLGGKTMYVRGEVHVILPAMFFLSKEAARLVLPDHTDEEFAAATQNRVQMGRRLAVHETQHAVMHQAGEGTLDLSDEPRARGTFLAIANDVVDEYRAELGVGADLRQDYEMSVDAATLSAFRAGLTRVVYSYQEHLNVERLMYEVLTETSHMWKALANVAAARRVTEISHELSLNAQDWDALAGHSWDDFEEVLSKIPSAHERATRDELYTFASDLADVLDRWLRHLGFRWRDTQQGRNAEFRITSRHILDEGR